MEDAQLLEQAAFANEAFYLAFEAKDFAAMDNLWSDSSDVMCLHPGWPALIGREAVMESWKGILGNPEQAQVSFYRPSFQRLGDSAVAVVCYEEMPGAVTVATNVFVVQDERLRMVVHQAGHCGNAPANSSA